MSCRVASRVLGVSTVVASACVFVCAFACACSSTSGKGAGARDAGHPDAGPADASAADRDASDSAAPVARGTGPGDWAVGDYPPELTAQKYLEINDVPGQKGPRQYKVHVPKGYDAKVPTPLVFCFHGLMQNAVMFCRDGAGLVAKSDAEGFLLVMPNGDSNSWNGGTCCGNASSSKLDDVALVRAIFHEVGTHLNVDLNRVYATGLSNGGFLSFRLACEAADIFAAVAPGSGTLAIDSIGGGDNTTSDFTKCSPSEPVSLLETHGTKDPLVPYKLQKPSLDLYAMQLGCKPKTMPATQPASSGDTKCIAYEGCPKGVELEGCTVDGGGHVWFGSDSCGTGAGPAGCGFVGANSKVLKNTDVMWEFLRRHHK